MRLCEYEGKELFRQCGIAIPVGYLVNTAEEARGAASKIGKEVMVKAQVLSGGRGKAGGRANNSYWDSYREDTINGQTEQNPLEIIQNNDSVRVDGEKGIVEVTTTS